MTRQVVVATRSDGKIRELNALVREFGFDALSLNDVKIGFDSREDLLESFETFEQNALAKARWFYARASGRVVLADDSGLEVDALNAMPGVHSKRWSNRSDLEGAALDQANNEFLWNAIDSAPSTGPLTARYVCAAACVSVAGELVVRGTTTGVLLRNPRGENGFGYDPYFVSTELGRTFAEVESGEKARVSHRGRAFRELFNQLLNDAVFVRLLS
ncbi:MAG: non-canonical purine NTP pyrophosphatase [Gemmatimonadaceae bacterium]